MKHLNDLLAEDTSAKLKIIEEKFKGTSGFLFLFKLYITNNIDPPREEVIPCFIDASGAVSHRISRYFEEAEKLNLMDLIKGEIILDFENTLKEAQAWIEERADGLYLEYQREKHEKLRDTQEKMAKYFQDKEKSLQAIAIDNIRESKLAEMSREKDSMEAEVFRRKQLAPYLDCLQIAYVEFE